MRPHNLDEFVGQAQLVGERGPLRKSVERGHLASILLWGPPGTGKTSLARILADAVGAEFATLSAVMSGVAEVRAAIAQAQERLALNGARSVLFIDEIHRFNKSQQDALLPHVEDGTVTLIGATTENPYFEVNSALLSRLRVWRLEPLTDADVGSILRRALADERGLAGPLGPAGGVALGEDAFHHLVSIAGGDARVALNVLEAAIALAEAEAARDAHGHVAPRLEEIEQAAQQRVLAYDRAGDGHYGAVSAFIKSLRGNDPDAALYWLAAMVAAGEDPRFIARRIIIAASEDVGNADPRALEIAVAAAQALDHVGLPEAQYALAQATVYVAATVKSNAVGRAYWAAMQDVLEHGSLPVPNHLRGAPLPQMKHHGIGVGYRDPHDFEGHDVAQQYLPDALHEMSRRYYNPTDEGVEARIGQRLQELRARRESTPVRRRAGAAEAGDPMRVAGRVTRARDAAKRAISDTQRRDAAAGDESQSRQ